MSTGYMYHEYDYTHWRLNGDFDINQRRRRLTRNIRNAQVCVCVCVCYQGASAGPLSPVSTTRVDGPS